MRGEGIIIPLPFTHDRGCEITVRLARLLPPNKLSGAAEDSLLLYSKHRRVGVAARRQRRGPLDPLVKIEIQSHHHLILNSLQLPVLLLRLDQHRQIRIRIFPQREEILIRLAAFGGVARERRCARVRALQRIVTMRHG